MRPRRRYNWPRGPTACVAGIIGVPSPAEDELTVNIRYASRHFNIPDGYLGRDKLILIGAAPGRPRGMGLFAQEDGTWLPTCSATGPSTGGRLTTRATWSF